jgi:hypothetical protein
VRGDDGVLRIPALADLPWFLPGLAISVVIGYLVRHRAAGSSERRRFSAGPSSSRSGSSRRRR